MTSTLDSHRPLIGLTGRRKKAGQLKDGFEILADLDGDWYYADYARGVLEAGGLPVHLPLDADPGLYVDRLDGFLFSGGGDIDARHYGMANSEHGDVTDPIRDNFEFALYKAAAAKALPVLGICRGIQLINVANGGTLHQHVPEHAAFDVDPATLLHDVKLEPESVLGSIYGDHHKVNSLHHQSVDRVGDGLRVTASHAGDIEGLEHESLPIVAVQWHPEMLATRASDPVFAWLVGAATEMMKSAQPRRT